MILMYSFITFLFLEAHTHSPHLCTLRVKVENSLSLVSTQFVFGGDPTLKHLSHILTRQAFTG
jgi:hypothetical protein